VAAQAFQRAAWRIIYTRRQTRCLSKIRDVLAQLGWVSIRVIV